MRTLLIDVVEGLVMACVPILEADAVVQGIITQHELAFPARIHVDVEESLFLGVPVIGRTINIIGNVNIRFRVGNHPVPAAIVVVDVDVGYQTQAKGTLAQVTAIVHTQGIVIKLLLIAVLGQSDHLGGILAVPCAVVIKPQAQFLTFLFQNAITEVHQEVGLGTAPHCEVAALVAEVVRCAVAVG